MIFHKSIALCEVCKRVVILQSVYSIGLHVHQVPGLKPTAEYKEVGQILAGWATERSSVRKEKLIFCCAFLTILDKRPRICL